MIYFGRRFSFSMGHRMHNPAWNDERNRRVYGKCNNPNGHGHQYTIELTFAAAIHPQTGFSANLVEVDDVVRRQILERFDHYDFNADFKEYADVISSGENLVRLFWELLAPHFPPSAPLVRLRLEETEKNSFEFFGFAPVRPGARIYA